MNSMARSILFLLSVALSVASMPATASAAEFGAIAFSTSTGAHGYSHNFKSRVQAERVALRACRAYGGGCRVVVYFYNACGALAVGRRNGYGFGWAPGRGTAKNIAMAACRQRTSSCRTVRSVCSR